MGLFNRRPKPHNLPSDSVSVSRVGGAPSVSEADPPRPARICASRTLVKSEPELAEMVAGEPRLQDGMIEITLVEKGFGTRVVIVAGEDSGLEAADLERLLDQLAEPQKRPFSKG